MRYCFSLVFVLGVLILNAQDYEWWNTKHNWDRVSPWTSYIKLSSKYMGPNALPVPELKTGQLSNKISFQNSAEVHFGKGNQTYNLFQNLYLPIIYNKVAIECYITPIEYYRTDTLARDRMVSRDKDGKGICGGDFYVSTQFQIFKEHGRIPDMLLSLNIKTASGTHLDAARYTNTPGYFFDLSLAKTISSSEKRKSRLFALIGFYSWQTYSDQNYQDDSFLYGFGHILVTRKLEFKTSIGGYYGYLNNGDRPTVARVSLKTIRNAPLNFQIHLQQGLNDYPFTSIRAGIVWQPRVRLWL